MAQKTQMVTITLEEYKELLLKDKPESSNDSVLLERFLNDIENKIEYSESSYSSDYIGNNMRINVDNKDVAELIKVLKYQNFDKYMSIYNNVMSKHRKDEDMKLKIKQMNNAKEIRNENK